MVGTPRASLNSYRLRRNEDGRLVAIYKRIVTRPYSWSSERIENQVIWHVAGYNGKLSKRARTLLLEMGFADPDRELLSDIERNPPPPPRKICHVSGIDCAKKAVVPMINRTTKQVDFELVLYGVTADELMTIPNEVIGSLARKYPNHQSSMFIVREAA